MLSQFLNIPWLPALAVMVYLILKKKKPNEITEEVIKTVIGYYLILAGAELAEMALAPLDQFLYTGYRIHGGILNTEIFGAVLLREYGNFGFAAFLTAFLVNYLLAAKTKKKCLFLTGHHLFFLSLMTVALIRHNLNISELWTLLGAGVMVGIYAYFSVRISMKSMSALKPASPSGLGNSATGAAYIGAAVGKLFRKGKDITYYDRKGKNTGYITSVGVLTVFVVYLILMLLTEGGMGWQRFRECCIYAFLYGAALSAIMMGLRMFLGVMIQMFWNTGKKRFPNLIVGLDCSAVIPYSPGAWRTGFYAASLTGTLTSIILIMGKAAFVPLPGLTSFYFAGGVAGVFGNTEGGKRGAAAAGAVLGITEVLLMSLLMSFMPDYYGYGAVLGETEYGILGCVLAGVMKMIKMIL